MRWVLVLLVVACSRPVHPTMALRADLLLVNCRGTTDAIAIRGEHIVAIGDDAKRVAAKRRIDVKGRLVIPGLHDAHVHEPSLFDAELVHGNASDDPSTTITAIAIAAKDAPPGRWLHGVLGNRSIDMGAL